MWFVVCVQRCLCAVLFWLCLCNLGVKCQSEKLCSKKLEKVCLPPALSDPAALYSVFLVLFEISCRDCLDAHYIFSVSFIAVIHSFISSFT